MRGRCVQERGCERSQDSCLDASSSRLLAHLSAPESAVRDYACSESTLPPVGPPPYWMCVLPTYTFASLPDHVVAQRFDAHAVQQRTDAPVFIAELAEFDARKLWAPVGYHSMYDYCLKKHLLDHHLTCRWIAIARVGQRYPVIFPALADGRLSQTTVLMLRPFLLSHTALALIQEAMGKTKRQVEKLLASKFPQQDVPTLLQTWTQPRAMIEPAQVRPANATAQEALSNNLVAPARVVPSNLPPAATLMVPLVQRAKVAPLSPGRNALQVTIDDETVELFEKAKDLLSHALPNADAGTVLKRALQYLVRDLERRKFAQVEHPRAAERATDGPRVSSEVKRQVRDRDGDACAFEGPDGNRCGSRYQLEWDHRHPVALGGRSTTENVRQLCRAHNQYEADRRFGRGFMERKRGRGV